MLVAFLRLYVMPTLLENAVGLVITVNLAKSIMVVGLTNVWILQAVTVGSVASLLVLALTILMVPYVEVLHIGERVNVIHKQTAHLFIPAPKSIFLPAAFLVPPTPVVMV
jgi:hypothetical protein